MRQFVIHVVDKNIASVPLDLSIMTKTEEMPDHITNFIRYYSQGFRTRLSFFLHLI